MGEFSVLGILAVLVLANYRFCRSVLYPPFIFCLMWLLDVSLYSMHLVRIDTVHAETFTVIAVGAVLFTAGGLLARMVPARLIRTRLVLFATKLRPAVNPRRTRWIKYLLVVILAAGSLYLVHNTLVDAAMGSGGSFFARARNAGLAAAGNSEQHNSIAPYLILWSIYLTVLFQVEERNRAFWAMGTIAFAACIFSTGRTDLLLLVSAVTGMHLLKTNRLSFRAALKFARWPALAFLALWVILIFTNKDTSGFGSSVAGIIELFLVSYIVGPMAALDYMLRHRADYTGLPEHTFKFFLSIAASLHLISYTPPPQYDVFVYVPFPTNVYTVYKFYITDFGVYGALATILIIGFLHTLIYRKARTGSKMWMYFFSLTLFAAMMVIFDDQYSAFGSYINILLVGGLYFFARSEAMLQLPDLRWRFRLLPRSTRS